MAKNFGLSFSWKRAWGINAAKINFAKQTGIPITEAGVEHKFDRMLIKFFWGKVG